MKIQSLSGKRVVLNGLRFAAVAGMVLAAAACGGQPKVSSPESTLAEAAKPSQDADALRKKAGVLYLGSSQGKEDVSCNFQMVASNNTQSNWLYMAYASMPGVDAKLQWGPIDEATFLGKISAASADYRSSWSDTSGELNPLASDHSFVVELAYGVPVKATYVKTNMHFPLIKQTIVCDKFTPAPKLF